MDQAAIDIRAFRHSLRALERQVELSLASEAECCGVTSAQCHLLLAVEDLGEPSVGDLAAALELDASTLSRTVEKLVRVGLLLRREDPENRRRQLVSLSEEGRDRAARINEHCDDYYGGLLASLPAGELQAIHRALPHFARALGEWRRGHRPSDCRAKGRGSRGPGLPRAAR